MSQYVSTLSANTESFYGKNKAMVEVTDLEISPVLKLHINIPANVAAFGLIPARRFDVPKSEIFNTPLYVLTSTLSPFMSLCTILLSC